MGKKVTGKFVWVIKNFSSLQSDKIYSDPFMIDGCRWQLLVYPKGNEVDYLSLYMEDLADYQSLPSQWRRKTYFRVMIVNQVSKRRSVRGETEHWFDGIPPRHWGFDSTIPLTELHAKDGGFLVNGRLLIVVEANVLNAIGGLDVSGKPEMATTKMLSKKTESMEANGLQIFPLQEEAVVALMEKRVEKKFVWVIKNFSFLNSEKCYSDPFVNRGFEWHLLAECDLVFLYLHLCVADRQSLPSEVVKVRLTIVNQLYERLSIFKDSSEHFFDEKSPTFGFTIPYELLAEDGGFLVNGELMIVAEVIGALDVFEESTPLRKLEVKGFHVLPSQVESVRRIFERHPEIAVEFRAKNQHLRTTFMNFLLSLIETLYQPLEELSSEDLAEADIALTYMKDVGFKVDWLEKKLDLLKVNKEKERSCEARVQVMEAQLHDLKHKVEAEKAKLSATRAPLSFDDFV